MKINIEGLTYRLDVEKAKKAGALRISRHVGQLYQDVNKHANGEVYVVALDEEDGHVSLICLGDWEPYATARAVEDAGDITDAEWDAITNGDSEDFVEVFVNKVPKNK